MTPSPQTVVVSLASRTILRTLVSLGFATAMLLAACGASEARETASNPTSTEPTLVTTSEPPASREPHAASDPPIERDAPLADGETPGRDSPPTAEATPNAQATCIPSLSEALRVAREALIADGVREDAFAGCTPATTRCGRADRSSEDEIHDACRVWVRAGDARVEVRFEPGTIPGAPDHAEAWLAEDLREVGRRWIGGSTHAVANGGALVLRGTTGRALHTHGGDAAHVGRATFVVRNTLGRDLALRATRVAWKVGHGDCLPPTTTRAELLPAYAALEGESATSTTVQIPMGVSTFEVGFPTQPAYSSWCDRFVASVRFEAEGASFDVESETMITRMQPFRR